MNCTAFRKHHLLAILRAFEGQSRPLDVFIMDYCRTHKALGAKDRKAIVDAIYGMMRWRGLLDYLIGETPSWEARAELFESFDPANTLNRTDIAPHIRCSFPKSLFDLFVANFGEEQALEIALICNTQAPTTVRANALKTSRDTLLAKWKQQSYQVQPCLKAQHGITFDVKINLMGLEEFREGLFEIQDEGSQLIAELVQAKPGDIILDFCSGAGGKALAIAAQMANRGQIFLHDIRKEALTEARRRLKRAGIQNAQTVTDLSPVLTKLKKGCDWVLVDVPCSGTGTIRRNPDMKWRFQAEWIDRLQGQQRLIFERALSYLKADGRIVYATCSLLREENEAQMDHFVRTYNLEVVGEPFKSLPVREGMDGFFGVIFQKKK